MLLLLLLTAVASIDAAVVIFGSLLFFDSDWDFCFCGDDIGDGSWKWTVGCFWCDSLLDVVDTTERRDPHALFDRGLAETIASQTKTNEYQSIYH